MDSLVRVWHGWTTPENAAAYEELLTGTVAPHIMAREIPGLTDFQVLRRAPREAGAEVEFVTIMTFDDWSAVAAFTGTDLTASVVPPAARALLSRFDDYSQHYDLIRRFRSHHGNQP